MLLFSLAGLTWSPGAWGEAGSEPATGCYKTLILTSFLQNIDGPSRVQAYFLYFQNNLVSLLLSFAGFNHFVSF